MSAWIITILVFCGIVSVLGIVFILVGSMKMTKKEKELHSADGLIEEKHYYQKAMMIWAPIALILLIIFNSTFNKAYATLKNLSIIFNMIVIMAPVSIIRYYLIKKNKDKIRPRPPMPIGAKIIWSICWLLILIYIGYEVYVFTSGKQSFITFY